VRPRSAALASRQHWLEDFASRLRAHPWVRESRLFLRAQSADRSEESERPTAFVVPSSEGVRALRLGGKQRLVAAWEPFLSRTGQRPMPEFDLWLVDALPPAGREREAVVDASRTVPMVLDLVRDAERPSLTCRVRVPYELPVLRGHFPSRPIVPGVVQIGWAVDIARTQGVVNGAFAGISVAKFRRILQPGMNLGLRLDGHDGSRQLHFEYSLGSTIVSGGRVQFGGAHA
jgi:3-hydroxymyristoyl/3-hydroxydecanoyl-(acyl carrier protein) dehydratase